MRIIQEKYTPDLVKPKPLQRRYYPFEKLKPGLCLEIIVAVDHHRELNMASKALYTYIKKNNKITANYKIKSNLSFIKIYCIR